MIAANVAYVTQITQESEYQDTESATYTMINIIQQSCPNTQRSDIVTVSIIATIPLTNATLLSYIFIFCSYWQRLNLAFKNTLFQITAKYNCICAIFLILVILDCICINLGVAFSIVSIVYVCMVFGSLLYIISSSIVCYLMFKHMNLFIKAFYIKKLHHLEALEQLRSDSPKDDQSSLATQLKLDLIISQGSADSGGSGSALSTTTNTPREKSMSGGVTLASINTINGINYNIGSASTVTSKQIADACAQQNKTDLKTRDLQKKKVITNEMVMDMDRAKSKIDLMLRLTILAVVTVGSSILLNVIIVIETALLDGLGNIYMLQQSMDTMINILCLALQFHFTTSIYRCCCKWCHMFLQHRYYETPIH